MHPLPLLQVLFQIGVVFHHIVADIIGDAFLETVERHIATGFFQPAHFRLREILVLPLQVFGHVDVGDMRFPVHGGKDGADEVVPGAGPAGPHVEDAAGRRCGQEPEHELHAILDVDEVAHLAAVGILRIIRFEEPHAAGTGDLRESTGICNKLLSIVLCENEKQFYHIIPLIVLNTDEEFLVQENRHLKEKGDRRRYTKENLHYCRQCTYHLDKIFL